MNPKLLLLFLFSPVFGLTHSIPQIGGPTYIPQNLTEEQKINHLIHYIEKMDAQFIRNGVSYSSTEAADHLRMKERRRENASKQQKNLLISLQANPASVERLIKSSLRMGVFLTLETFYTMN